MKRLVDEAHPSGSAEHFLASALLATPRIEPEPLEMQRVLARVGDASRRARVRMLRVVVALAVVLLAIAAAAAVAIRARGMRASFPLVATVPAPIAAPSPAATTSGAPLPEPSGSEERSDAVRPASSVALARPKVASGPRAGEDPTQVLEAIRALRRDDDPARAGALLSRYLSTHPRGVLTEDALALSIEAANSRHDARAAADLGRRYLAQFPTGRYRAFALQAVQPPAR